MDAYFPRRAAIDDPEYRAARAEVEFEDCVQSVWWGTPGLDAMALHWASVARAERTTRAGSDAVIAGGAMPRRPRTLAALASGFAARLARAFDDACARCGIRTAHPRRLGSSLALGVAPVPVPGMLTARSVDTRLPSAAPAAHAVIAAAAVPTTPTV